VTLALVVDTETSFTLTIFMQLIAPATVTTRTLVLFFVIVVVELVA
jgi:hypothetical protein